MRRYRHKREARVRLDAMDAEMIRIRKHDPPAQSLRFAAVQRAEVIFFRAISRGHGYGHELVTLVGIREQLEVTYD